MNRKDFKYHIGQIIVDDKRDITIIDRKYFKKNNDNKEYKQYKIKCNICGFNSGEHYLNNTGREFRGEYWVIESNILKGKGCPCCSNKIVVKGINDICTTDHWMVKYFQNGEKEASKYVSGSTMKIYPTCPDCGKLKNNSIMIRDIQKHRSIGCICGDGNSYPNKFAYAVFTQIRDQLEFYQNEYSPDWIGRYRYDNYFVVDGINYVLEMDGELGHGKIVYGCNKNIIDKEGLARDKLKEIAAKNHQINVIRVNAEKSDGIYLKNQITKSLQSIVDLSNVNWKNVYEYAENNLVKTVCHFYNETNKNTYQMEKLLGLDRTTISKYLKKGNKLGWCNYKNHITKKNDNARKVAKIINQNQHITTTQLSEILGHDVPVIWNWIHRAEELGLCVYKLKNVHRSKIAALVENM